MSKNYKIAPQEREAAKALRDSAEYRSKVAVNYAATVARINQLFISEPFPLAYKQAKSEVIQ